MSDNPVIASTQTLVAQIVSGYLKKNHVLPADIPALIATVHQALTALGNAAEPTPQNLQFQSDNPFAPTMSCAWNAGGAGTCCGGTFWTSTD